jgi:hypothetical protein
MLLTSRLRITGVASQAFLADAGLGRDAAARHDYATWPFVGHSGQKVHSQAPPLDRTTGDTKWSENSAANSSLTGDATEPASDGYLLSVGSEARVPAVSVEARHLLLAFITIPQAIP